MIGKNKTLMKMMENAVFEVFEKMFFIFLIPKNVRHNDYDMEALISFSGPLQGEIKLLLSTEMARSMVQNMLDLGESEITESAIEDCAKEAANMICGNFLAKLDGTKNFDLSLPLLKKCDDSALFQHAKGSMINRFDFDADEGKTGLMLQMIQ